MICARRHSGSAASWRAGLGALAMLLFLPAAAAAADFPVLRGSLFDGYANWQGWNLGAQVGTASMNTDFNQASADAVADMLRNSTLEAENNVSGWNVLSSDTSNGQTYGAFLGYSWQMDQLVLGFDFGYNRLTSLETSQGPKTLGRVVSTSDGTTHTVYTTAQSSVNLIDYGTFRMRAGYAFGQFLPYVTFGGAVGRFDFNTSVSLVDYMVASDSSTSTYAPAPQTDSRNNAYVAGVDVGLGLDVLILPNVFLRGEWEYIAFAEFHQIRSSMNVGRVGLGIKF